MTEPADPGSPATGDDGDAGDADAATPGSSPDDGGHPALAHAHDLVAYLDASPSPFHAVAEAQRRLQAAGFTRVDPAGTWPEEPGRYVVARGGSLIAWIAPPADPGEVRFDLVGAHTDSPNLRLKPHPDTGRARWRQLGVEVYGGALYNSWLDRDLGLSGRVTVRGPDGPTIHLVRTDEPIARVPQLAIHLDRGVNDGLKLNPQQHLVPVWSLGDAGRTTEEEAGLRDFVADLLAAQRGEWVDAADIAGWDLMFHDTNPACVAGRFGEWISSGRLDNLLSCHAGVCALVEAGASPAAHRATVPVLSLFDHEEIGSQSATGAQGAWLAQVLERIALARGASRGEFLAALAASRCLSVDGAHATHPNYADRHDPDHHVHLDGGPVIKVNANQRYATDADSVGWLVDAFDRAGVPHQVFVSRTDMPCGSTIGPATAAGLGVSTVDVGAAMLAMHSARELSGVVDAWRLSRLLTTVFAGSDAAG